MREFGNLFRDGLSQLLGRTADSGWNTEVYRNTDKGRRFIDNAHTLGKRGAEFKAGKLGREAFRQLGKDEYLLERGWELEWFIGPKSTMTKEVADKARDLLERFPGQFALERVTPEQFKTAIELGKELAKQREQRERDLELAKTLDRGKEVAAKNKTLAKDVQAQVRAVDQARELGQTPTLEHLREQHTILDKSLEQVRNIERDQTRDMLNTLGLSKEQSQEMAKILGQNLEARREPVVQGIAVLGLIAEREEQSRIAREAGDKFLEQQRDRLEQAGVPEVAIKALELVNKGVVPPMVVVERADLGPASEVVRGGRAAELARVRAVEKERGRRG